MGPLPRFDGIDMPSATISRGAAPQPPKARNVVPPLTPDDRAKYFQTWTSVSQGNDLLIGDRARTIFEKANLPVEQLGDIWALTDRTERGALDTTEFIVAMHLIQSVMNGSLKVIPAQLPPALFEAASLGAPSARAQRQQASISSIQSDQFPASRQTVTVPMRSQVTGPLQKSSPVLQQGVGQQRAPAQSMQPQMSGLAQSIEWDVKPHEKANYDTLFNDIDKSGKGYATGEEAVTFFLQSKLPQDDLAQIWDICTAWDNYSGELRKDWFAVAMHLIKAKLGGKDLPKVIPPSLIPPSERARVLQTTGASAPVPPPAAAQVSSQHPSSAAADLFGLNDSFSAPAPSQSQSPPAQAFTDNYAAIDRIASPPVTSLTFRSLPGPGNQPAFVPSSSFGQSIKQQAPQIPTQVPTQQYPVTRQLDQDLLGDAHPQESRNIHADSTEIANLRNQMSSLTTQQEQTNQERSVVETDIEKLKQEKASLTAQLQQVRQTYDQEVKTVRALQVQQGSLRQETRELLKEVSLLEASLEAVQQQHDQINAQLQKDRADNAAIKERIKSANEQTVTLKATLEKVQKDAKQQRGLVAINTKQLNTLEAGHEKLNTEIEEEQSRAAAEQAQYIEAQRIAAIERERAAAQQAQYAESQRIAAIERERAAANEEQRRSVLASPALSTSSASTNPFHRMTSTGNAATTQRNLLSQSSGPAFPFVPAAAAGATLAGVGSAAAAVAFGHQEGDIAESENHIQRPAPVNVEDDYSSSYNTAPTTAEPQSATLSGFEHAFSTTTTTEPELSNSVPYSAGLSEPPAFSELPIVQDAPQDTAPSEFQTYKHDASEFDNESSAAHGVPQSDNSEQFVAPQAIVGQAQNWSSTDVFTSDPRTASPSLQFAGVKAMAAPSSKLGLSSGNSDTGSASTSVQAQAPASVQEAPFDSRPLTPASIGFDSEPASAARPAEPMESSTEEHELPKTFGPSDVQRTLSSAPRDDSFALLGAPTRTLSPAVPGAFPNEASQSVSQEYEPNLFTDELRSNTFSESDAPVSQNSGFVQSQTVESTTFEADSSDDETIEQPRGSDMFANSVMSQKDSSQVDRDHENETGSSNTATRENETASITTSIAATATSFFGSFLPSLTTTSELQSSDQPEAAAPADDFDEFDDLEEAAEVDDDEEGETSYAHDTFEPHFDAPSARESIMTPPPLKVMTTPMPRPGAATQQASPARDFSEFAHYSSVIAEPEGLAPPIVGNEFTPPTMSVATSQTQSAFNPSPVQAQAFSQSNHAPPPPASRYGASLAPKRPEPARAISAADDPMLIELMDMGFDREKSVKALEDYNYDLGKATDFLLRGN